jgi:hypothetical protein
MLITFDNEIFSVKAMEKTPENLTLEYLIEDESIMVKPFLFNSDEEFLLEIVSSSKSFPTVDSRIAGISSIKESFPSENPILKVAITLTLSFVLLVFYSKSFWLLLKRKNQKASNTILLVTCSFSSILLVKSVIDIETYKWYLFASIVVPITLGIYWARLESGYNKPIQPTADASSD